MINQPRQLRPHRFLEVQPRFLEANLRLHLQPSQPRQPQRPQPLAELLLLKPHLHLFLEVRNLYLEEVRPRRLLQHPLLPPRPVQQLLQRVFLVRKLLLFYFFLYIGCTSASYTAQRCVFWIYYCHGKGQ